MSKEETTNDGGEIKKGSQGKETVLAVRNISKRYEIYAKPVDRLWQMLHAGRKQFFKEFWALKNINFEIRRGESVGIIGRNGAGKSTILQIITGTLRATQGSIWRKPGLRVAALLELGSGFNPEFTGRENVYLNASILGLSRKETEKRYKEIIDFADIGDFIDQPVKKYSSGMKVRLAFAVQIMVRPDILIVDEALAVGDMFFQQKCMHYMRKLREQGMTLLFVSHSLGTVRSLCEKAVFLDKGRQVAFGDAEKVCNMYWNEAVLKKQTKEAKPAKESKAAAVASAAAATPPKTGANNAAAADAAAEIVYREDQTLEKKISDRRGSGALRFTSFFLYRPDGTPVSIASRGERLVLAASVVATEDVPEGATFAFSCNTKTVEGILLYHSLLDNTTLGAMRKGEKCVIKVSFPSPFLRGRYFFNFSLKPDQYSKFYYDHVFNGMCYEAKLPYSMQELGIFGITALDDTKISIEKGGTK